MYIILGMSIKRIFTTILIVGSQQLVNSLRLCGLYEDTYGQWIDFSNHPSEEERREIRRHFLGDPGDAMRFHKVQKENEFL
jgi:hypothetical protein